MKSNRASCPSKHQNSKGGSLEIAVIFDKRRLHGGTPDPPTPENTSKLPDGQNMGERSKGVVSMMFPAGKVAPLPPRSHR